MNSGEQDSLAPYISDKYTLEEKLGGGTFSTVYKATQTATGQNVAVKVLRFTNEVSDREKTRQKERFKREMKICSNLYHPSIVSVLDFGQTANGTFFTVFEYIPGQTLTALVEKEGALTIKRTLAIMTQVLEGLSVAHGHEVIHRDLKPENIMVTVVGSTEQAMILDFGISTFASDRNSEFNRVTMTREFLGTPVYSAPEQLRAARVTFKSDIYSWGLVFLKCLLGRHPYGESSVADVIQKQLSKVPVPIPSILMEHPLGMILRWVLEKESNRRPGNAGHLLARVKGISPESLASLPAYVGEFAFSSTPPGIILEYEVPDVERTSYLNGCHPVTVLCLSIDFLLSGDNQQVGLIDEIYVNIKKSCLEIITSMKGILAGECGGLFLFLFENPNDSELDAKMAGDASLRLAELIMRFNVKYKQRAGAEIKYRIGIHTGETTEKRKSGETPSGFVFWMARQLTAIANIGEIIASESSVVSLRDEMAVATLHRPRAHSLRHVGNLYRIKGRLDIFGKRLNGNRRTKMFGRQDDLQLLTQYWEKSLQGKGSAILIQGDAGEGKTRLLTEFISYLRGHGGTYMEVVCTPETRYSPLFPLMEYIRKLLLPGRLILSDETAGFIAASLRKRGLATPENIGIFASWFGVTHPEYPPPSCSPQKMTGLLLEAICSLLITESRSTHAVIVVEDLHWADNATLSLLNDILKSVKMNGRLLIMSARNGFDPEWPSSEVMVHKLRPLKTDSIDNIIKAIDEKDTLSNDVRTKIIRKAEGVPLFAEELAIAAVDQVNKNGTITVGGTPSSIRIPSNLKELLTSKLNKLGIAKKSAQLASVIGREFPYSALAAIHQDDETILLADLDALVSAGIIHADYYESEFYYTFHHSLVRDAAYESISESGKRLIHGKLSKVLETQYDDFTKAHPDQMAVHFACAGEYHKAVEYALLSAEKSLSRSFYNETIEHIQQAMTWADKLDTRSSTNEAKLRLHQLLAPALIATQGYASPKLLEEVQKAERCLDNIPESSELRFPVLWGMIIYCHTRPVYDKLEILLEEAFRAARSTQSENDLAALLAIKGHRLFSKGHFGEAVENLMAALKHYAPATVTYHANRYGHDTKIFSLSTLALIFAARGELENAEQAIEDALQWGQEMDSAQSTAMAMAYEIGMWHYRNEPGTVAILAKKLVQYAQAKDTTMWNFVASFLGGWANRSVQNIQEGLTLFTNLGIGQFGSYWHFTLAQVHCMNGEFEKALAILDHHIEQANRLEETFYLPELYRLKAKIYRLSTKIEIGDGISFATKAISLAEATGARLFELRAYLELSKLMGDEVFLKNYKPQLTNLVQQLDTALPLRELNEAKVLLDKQTSFDEAKERGTP